MSNERKDEEPNQPEYIENESTSASSSRLLESLQRQDIDENLQDDDSITSDSVRSNGSSRFMPKAQPFNAVHENKSPSVQRRPGELRIIIDRPEGDRLRTTEDALPSVRENQPSPSPLGTRPFNSEDDLLRNTDRVRTSAQKSRMLSMSFENSASLLSVKAHASGSLLPDRPSFIESMFSGAVDGAERSNRLPVTENPSVYKLKEPIGPSIFDVLLEDVNDPSVVRFTPGSKIVSAATPERIVAEISSESFMDYELVSDFFLTFRSYLSTSDLLSLLLARLQWAINRLQDDGRIIRIRTFAAIRHWILNYFVDDFVPNYSLRAQFCDNINAMYDRTRSGGNVNAGDLKILLDLKRCWYGRGSFYFDSSGVPSVLDDPDSAIVPGEASSYDGNGGMYQDIVIHADVPTISADNRQSVGQGDEAWRSSPERIQNESAATAKSPTVSSTDDQSFQVNSCSLFPMSVKPLPRLDGARAPHPVPLVQPRLAGDSSGSSAEPRNQQIYSHMHKHSGSFSDSARDDRAPRDQISPTSMVELSVLGSLIRGNLYPPAESIMAFTSPPSVAFPGNNSGVAPGSNESAKPTNFPSSLGVKSIIGSIRRALGNKSSGESSDGRRPSDLPRFSTLPTNVVLGSRMNRKSMAAPQKRRLLVDFLCEEVLKQYRSAVADRREEEEYAAGKSDFPGLESTAAASSAGSQARYPGQTGPTRVRSRLTSGSQSIVIVDGTGMNVPMMQGAVSGPQNEANSSRIFSWGFPSQASTYMDDKRSSYPICYDARLPRSATPEDSQRFGSEASGRSAYIFGRGSVHRASLPTLLGPRSFVASRGEASRQRRTMHGEVPSYNSTSGSDSYRPVSRMSRQRPSDTKRIRDNLSYVSSITECDSVPRSSITEGNDHETTLEAQDAYDPSPGPSQQPSVTRTRSPSDDQRPSFEETIAHFAEIPDDGDGGVESTLLKLEGKWKKESDGGKLPQKDNFQVTDAGGESGKQYEGGQFSYQPIDDKEKPGGLNDNSARRRLVLGGGTTYSQVGGRLAPPRPYSEYNVDSSQDGSCIIPVLERGLNDDSMKRGDYSQVSSYAGPVFSKEISEEGMQGDSASKHASYDVVQVTDSLKDIARGSTQPQSEASEGSLRASSVDVTGQYEDNEDEAMSTAGFSFNETFFEIPPHPLAHPPSPAMSTQDRDSASLRTKPMDPVSFKALPLTPEISPQPRNQKREDHDRSRNVQQVSSDVLMNSEKDYREQEMRHAEHVPFILSYESQILAQQLTLVEMAALSEVDWKDLIDMKWSDGTLWSSSWVQFLSESNRRGIDLVVGRFNLMVKWVQSEIVLTESIENRARAISKFIHTAAHAKNICNYSTTLQICIALSSSVCSRLKKTWAHVPPPDKRLLKDIETLTQPVRNFQGLRVEMETANVQDGCIPFVGKFTLSLFLAGSYCLFFDA